LIHINKKLKPN